MNTLHEHPRLHVFFIATEAFPDLRRPMCAACGGSSVCADSGGRAQRAAFVTMVVKSFLQKTLMAGGLGKPIAPTSLCKKSIEKAVVPLGYLSRCTEPARLLTHVRRRRILPQVAEEGLRIHRETAHSTEVLMETLKTCPSEERNNN